MGIRKWAMGVTPLLLLLGTTACGDKQRSDPPAKAAPSKTATPTGDQPLRGPLTNEVALALLHRWTETQNRGDATANAALYADAVTADLRVRGRAFRFSRGPFLAQRTAALKERARITTRNVAVHVAHGAATVSFSGTRRAKDVDEGFIATLTLAETAAGVHIVREQWADAIVAPPPEALPELQPNKFAFVLTAGETSFVVLGASSAAPGNTEGIFGTVSVTASEPAAGRPGLAVATRAPSKAIAWNNEGWAHKPFRAYGAGGSCTGVTGDLAVLRVTSPPAAVLRAWSKDSDAQKVGAEIWAWQPTKEFTAVEIPRTACTVTDLAWAHIGDTRERKALSSMYPADVAGPAANAFQATPFVLDRTTSYQARVPAFAWNREDFAVQVWGKKTQRMLVTVQGDRPSRCDAPSVLGLFAVANDTYRPLSVVDGFTRVQLVTDVDGDGRMDLVGTDATGAPVLARQGTTSLVLIPSNLPGPIPDCGP